MSHLGRPRIADAEPLDRLFHALADGTRRRILARLAVGSATVTSLARPYRMSLPAVSKHLKVLEEAGLISRRVDGRIHRLALRGERLERVEAWLDPFRAYWDHTLSALNDDLRKHPSDRKRGRPPTGRARGDSNP